MECLIFQFCSTRDLWVSVANVCRTWERCTRVNERCWTHVQTPTPAVVDTVLDKWRKRGHLGTVTRHLTAHVPALYRWLDHDGDSKGHLFVSSFSSLQLIVSKKDAKLHHCRMEWKEESKDEVMKTIRTLAEHVKEWDSPSPWRRPTPDIYIHCLTSIELRCEMVYSKILYPCVNLRELYLDTCEWQLADDPLLTLSLPHLETLEMKGSRVTTLDQLRCAPSLTSLTLDRVVEVSDKPRDNGWVPPITLKTLRYVQVHASTSYPIQLRMDSSSSLTSLQTETYLLHSPSDGRLVLNQLTDLTLYGIGALDFSFEVPNLLSLYLCKDKDTLFSFDRLVVGTSLRSCRVDMPTRRSMIHTLEFLARHPRPGCVIGVWPPMGGFNLQPGDEGESSDQHRERNRVEGGVVSLRICRTRTYTRQSYTKTWRECVARSWTFHSPRRFHSIMERCRDGVAIVDESVSVAFDTMPLLSCVRTLAQHGALVTQEDTTAQYACPTDHPTCLCRLALAL